MREIEAVMARHGRIEEITQLDEKVGNVREGRHRLKQELAQAEAKVRELASTSKVDAERQLQENSEMVEKARARLGELDEAVRLLVRKDPAKVAEAYNLARTDVERALQEKFGPFRRSVGCRDRMIRNLSTVMYTAGEGHYR